jgi:hypothetical protein
MTRLAAKWFDPRVKAVLLDFLERAGWSAGQVFLATLLAGGTAGSVGTLPWKYALTLAVSAAVASIILTALQYVGKWTDLTFWQDLLARLAKTFLSSLSGSIVASGVFDITRFSWTVAFNVAFIATIGGLAKGLLAREHVIPVTAAGSTAIAGTPAVPGPTAPAPTSPIPASPETAAPPAGVAVKEEQVAVPAQPAPVVIEVPQPSPSTLPTEMYREAIR